MSKEAASLPEGIADVEMNRAELAEAMAVSVNTVDNWVRAGMPFLEKGANGRSYRFQLSDCYAWRKTRDGEEEARKQSAAESAAQLRLAFVNADPERARRARLTPKEQREIALAQITYMQAARQRRELVPVDEVQEVLETVFSSLRDALDALPDRLAREVGLTADQTERAVTACDDALRDAQQRIAGASMEPIPVEELALA